MEIKATFRGVNPRTTNLPPAHSRPACPAATCPGAGLAVARRAFQRVLHTRGTEAENRWARAYLRGDVRIRLDAQRVDPLVLPVISARQAWQFQVLPLRREGGVLLLAAPEGCLVRAARFALRVCGEPALVLVADEARFRRYLSVYYPWPDVEKLLA